MKIALLHYSFWPEIGGVEQVMRDQATLLHRQGHEVRVISGVSFNPNDGYTVEILPELAPDFELNEQVADVLGRGQADQNFSRYRGILAAALEQALGESDLTLVHNAFTMHLNLALTCALHDVAPRHRLVAWTHDLVSGNSDYALPNPTRPPWNLMRTSNPHVTYVAVSELGADELKEQLQPPVEPVVIPDLIDLGRFFGFTPEMRASLDALALPRRDFIFLLPAQTMPRKNIDFAIDVVRELRTSGRDPLLLITGAVVPGQSASEGYGAFLRQSLPAEVAEDVIFVSDHFPVQDEVLRDLYLLADCLLFPSQRESFGLPILEAALSRLPIWCRDIPASRALAEEGSAYLLDDLSGLAEAVEWLESQPTFRAQRRCRQLFDPDTVYQQYYEPLLGSLAPS